MQVAAENDSSLRGRCAELEAVIADLRHQLDVEAERLAEHAAASQRAAEQSEEHVGRLTADNDDLRAQLKVCIPSDCELSQWVISTLHSGL